jgi:uncharacterized iron-regulated membrane protein
MFISARKTLIFLHGWLGSLSAIFIILVAGSGAMLAFVGQLFLVQYGDILRASPPTQTTQIVSVTQLIDSAKTGYKDHFQTIGVLMPHSRVDDVETAMVFGMPSGSDAIDGIRMLSVDPWIAKFKGDFPLSGAFAHELIDFHHSFLLGNAGIIFVCILSILLMFFVITGIYLWCLKQGTMWDKLTRIDFRSDIKKICFTWHLWLGAWSALFIVYFCLTGLALAKPAWFSPLLSPPTYEVPDSAGFEKTCHETITPSDAETAGIKAFPTKELAIFFLPNKKNGPYMLTYRSSKDNNKRDGDSRIFVHGSCKNLVYIENAETLSLSAQVTGMLLSLHGGYTFGKLGGSILVLLTGLSLVILSATGLVTFLTRKIKRKRQIGNFE